MAEMRSFALKIEIFTVVAQALPVLFVLLYFECSFNNIPNCKKSLQRDMCHFVGHHPGYQDPLSKST